MCDEAASTPENPSCSSITTEHTLGLMGSDGEQEIDVGEGVWVWRGQTVSKCKCKEEKKKNGMTKKSVFDGWNVG